MGLTLFIWKYLQFSESEVTILLPTTVFNIRFRPGQAYLFGIGGISPKILRHHKLEMAYTPFWVTYSEKHPFLLHYIAGFCEKYSLYHIFVDFDTLIEWSE